MSQPLAQLDSKVASKYPAAAGKLVQLLDKRKLIKEDYLDETKVLAERLDEVDLEYRTAVNAYVRTSEILHVRHQTTVQELAEAEAEAQRALLDREVSCVKARAGVDRRDQAQGHRHRLEVAVALFGFALEALAVFFLLRRVAVPPPPLGGDAPSRASTLALVSRDLGPGLSLAVIGAWMLALTLMDPQPDDAPLPSLPDVESSPTDDGDVAS